MIWLPSATLHLDNGRCVVVGIAVEVASLFTWAYTTARAENKVINNTVFNVDG